jgi:hypothetical protein
MKTTRTLLITLTLGTLFATALVCLNYHECGHALACPGTHD